MADEPYCPDEDTWRFEAVPCQCGSGIHWEDCPCNTGDGGGIE